MQSKYKKVEYNQERAKGRQIVMPQSIEQNQRKSEFISRLQNDVGLSVKKTFAEFCLADINLLQHGLILLLACMYG